MGCDIHIFAEVKNKENGKWEKVGDHFTMDKYDQQLYKKEKGNSPFDWRNYSMFAFFAGVRNYDHCEPISEPKGLPNDSEYLNSVSKDAYDYNPMSGKAIPESERQTVKMDIEENEYHNYSYLTLLELTEFDYDKTFWNRRIYKPTYREDGTCSGGNGAVLAKEGEGIIISYRENLGGWYFKHLEELKQLGEPDNVRIIFWFDN